MVNVLSTLQSFKIFIKYILKILLALFQVRRRSVSPDMYTKFIDNISVALRFIGCPRTYTYVIYCHNLMHFNILLLKVSSYFKM